MAKNQDESVQEVESAFADTEPRVYELGFHLDPELPTEEVKKAFEAVRGTITAAGTVVAEVEPRKIQLAYTISRQEVGGRRDFNSAYFAWIVYEANAEGHEAVVSAAKGNGAIVRFLDILTTKEQARHALEMHELMQKNEEAAETSVDEEEAMDSELDAALENVTV